MYKIADVAQVMKTQTKQQQQQQQQQQLIV